MSSFILIKTDLRHGILMIIDLPQGFCDVYIKVKEKSTSLLSDFDSSASLSNSEFISVPFHTLCSLLSGVLRINMFWDFLLKEWQLLWCQSTCIVG